jgi:hypothetical protein
MIIADDARTDSPVWVDSEVEEEVCEVDSVWLVEWVEVALSQASEAASKVVCEAVSSLVSEVDSEVVVALAHLVDSRAVEDTWLGDETLVTTCMPITMVPKEVQEV